MIRNKKVRKRKTIVALQEPKILEEAREAKASLKEAKQLGYKIIYADEFCTTRNTLMTHSWSCKNEPLQVE